MVMLICLIFLGLIKYFSGSKRNEKSKSILGVVISAIQILSVFIGGYFNTIMFSNKDYSFSVYLLVVFILSLTYVSNPYYSSALILVSFLGLTLYTNSYIVQLSYFIGDFLIAVIFVILLCIGNIMNFNGQLKLFLQEIEISKANAKLEEISQTDELTGIYNRRKSADVISENIEIASRYKYCFSIALIDIDNFKTVNDTYGHNVGDLVLQQFVNNIKNMLRSTDILGRWGGEEFIIITPNCKEDEAYFLVERLRKKNEEIYFPKVGKVTFSAGISIYENQDDFSKLVDKADKALYAAKNEGRNQTQIFQIDK
jgi:diguanylate cyclase (GGDEF)-like protein